MKAKLKYEGKLTKKEGMKKEVRNNVVEWDQINKYT